MWRTQTQDFEVPYSVAIVTLDEGLELVNAPKPLARISLVFGGTLITWWFKAIEPRTPARFPMKAPLSPLGGAFIGASDGLPPKARLFEKARSTPHRMPQPIGGLHDSEYFLINFTSNRPYSVLSTSPTTTPPR